MHTLRYITIFFIRKESLIFGKFLCPSNHALSLTLIWSQMFQGRHGFELLIYRSVLLVFLSCKALHGVGHPLSALLLESIERRNRSTLLRALLNRWRVDSRGRCHRIYVV